jgi:hypothetical protein
VSPAIGTVVAYLIVAILLAVQAVLYIGLPLAVLYLLVKFINWVRFWFD